MKLLHFIIGAIFLLSISLFALQKQVVIKISTSDKNSTKKIEKPKNIEKIRVVEKIIYKKIEVKPPKKRYKVVIISGHVENPRLTFSRDSRGAKSYKGIYEYKFNDKIVKYFKQKEYQLKDVSYEIVLATQNVGLKERVSYVNKIVKPDLYIEVHHDSAEYRDIKEAKKEGINSKLWDVMSGYSLHISSKNRFFNKNLEFSILLSDELANNGFKPNLYHHKIKKFKSIDEKRAIYDRVKPFRLFVLNKAKIPAVILESATIINPKEENMIEKEQNRIKIVNAINEAIKKFFNIK